MKNLELQEALKRLPPNAEIYVKPSSGAQMQIDGLQVRLPETIPLDKPGVAWADVVSDAMSGLIVCSLPVKKPEVDRGGQ